jgi:hypothetical protein
MLSSKQILDLVGQEPKPALAGRVAQHQRSMRTSTNATSGPASHVKFLADMAAQFTSTPRAPEKYLHPGEDPKAMPDTRWTGLSPAGLAWLQGLPTDPEQVSYDDAVQLAKMAANTSAFKDAQSALLVGQKWVPVKEVHDGRAAQAVLTNAQVSAPSVPSSVMPALTDAIAAETPTLEPDEAVAPAGARLRAVLDQRSTAREGKVLDARAAIAKAGEARARRTSTTKIIYDQSRPASLGGWTGS